MLSFCFETFLLFYFSSINFISSFPNISLNNSSFNDVSIRLDILFPLNSQTTHALSFTNVCRVLFFCQKSVAWSNSWPQVGLWWMIHILLHDEYAAVNRRLNFSISLKQDRLFIFRHFFHIDKWCLCFLSWYSLSDLCLCSICNMWHCSSQLFRCRCFLLAEGFHLTTSCRLLHCTLQF